MGRVYPPARAAAVAALAVAVAASFISAPVIAASRPTPPLAVACWRLALAAVVLLPPAAPRVLGASALRQRAAWGLAALASLALAAHFLLWISSLRWTDIAAAATLVNASPLALVAMEYRWFKRVPRPRQWAGIITAVLGTALISGGDWTLTPRALAGDGLALGGALTYGLYLVVGRALRPALEATVYNFVIFALAAVILMVAGILSHTPLAGFSWHIWLLLGVLALVPTLLGHALANYSLGQLSATTVGLAYLLEPVGAALLGYLWLQQVPSLPEVLGGALTLGGLGLYVYAGHPGPRPSAPRIDGS